MLHYTKPTAEINVFDVEEPTMLNIASVIVPDPEGFEGGGLH